MPVIPSAIIFVNNDLTDNTQDHLVRQLQISEVIDGAIFDARVAADEEYPAKIKQLNLRLMVVRSFDELTNRDLADVVIFVKNGMAAVESSNLGPPGQSYSLLNLNWQALKSFRY